MASSGVRVENALASHGVDHGFSLLEGFLSGGLVAGDDELAHGLDGGAELAALSREVHVAHNHLAGALASLLGIGHFFKFLACKLNSWRPEHPDGMPDPGVPVVRIMRCPDAAA